MAAQDAEGPKSRPPTIDDLLAVCKKLNEKDVRYVLIGGFAMNYYGFPRATEDIDLLVDPLNDNISKSKMPSHFYLIMLSGKLLLMM